jgi:nucleoside-diphosphate-sugar epimerase
LPPIRFLWEVRVEYGEAFARPRVASVPRGRMLHSELGLFMKRVLILGVNGFIGHHLSQSILRSNDWEIYGMDMQTDRIGDLMSEPRFHFFEGDITINREWIEYHVKKCDVVLPLVAIATPATYVREPLRVFELDFEANLPIVRACVRYRKRIVFPSTSEVYGMSRDSEFDSESSELVLGPINKPRWIYSCAKQLMDRVIHAYGMQEGLDYTLFRPFNWIGAGLDSINTAKEGSSRVITQFLGHIVRGEAIKLVDGGTQKRAFTYIDDGIAALLKIIANKDGIASGKIYNIGNPANNWSVRELAEKMLALAKRYPEYADNAAKVTLVETTADAYYGKGYQDVQNRVPKITNTCADLDWKPVVAMDDALTRIFDAYRGQVAEARGLVD